MHMKALLIFLSLGQVNPFHSTQPQPLDSQRDLLPCFQRSMAVVRNNRPTSYSLYRGDSQ